MKRLFTSGNCGICISIACLTLFLFSSCDDNGEPVPALIERTVIVYMVADNNLNSFASKNIEQMTAGLDFDSRNMIIYLDGHDDPPCLIKVQKRGNEIVKTYPEQNSADPVTLHTVLNEIIHLYPSLSYGLVLWSHATSWVPEGVKLRSFGQDDKREMDIKELAKALPVRFDYILFDGCLMGSVEVAYQLKDKTDYIVSSATETLANGFPYEKVTPLLFGGRTELVTIAIEYYNYYSNQKGEYNSATISVIQTNELSQLAYLTNQLTASFPLERWNYKQDYIQLFDFFENHIAYDFLDFLQINYPVQSVQIIENQLKKVILYKANTDMILEILNINRFCGISCYVPSPNNVQINDYYQSLSWSQHSGFYRFF